jgi:hypothetical protein
MGPSPSPDELAAIAAAYVLQTARDDVAAPPVTSRWRLAARLPVAPARARFAGAISRWKAAGRLDG